MITFPSVLVMILVTVVIKNWDGEMETAKRFRARQVILYARVYCDLKILLPS